MERQLMNLICSGVLAALAGCATNPATGLAANGQPLGVKTETEHWAMRQQTKVAEVQYRDSRGRAAGSANVYKNQVVQGSTVHWWPTQGGTVIDDQDFFRIAGDDKAARDIADHRAGGITMNRIGWGLMVLGAGGLGATGAFMDDSSGAGKTLGGVSVLALITGGLWAYYGYHRMKPESHVFELDRARQAADRYNATLGAPAGSASASSSAPAGDPVSSAP